MSRSWIVWLFIFLGILALFGGNSESAITWQSLATSIGSNSAWMVIFVLASATLASEDMTCIVAGLLVSTGELSFVIAVFGCAIGIFIGDMGLFLIGKIIGQPLVKIRPFSWMVHQEDLDKGKQWIEDKGAKIIIASRFLPGTRIPVYVTAGVLNTNIFIFMGYFGIAVLLWTPVLVLISSLLGNYLIVFFTTFQNQAFALLFFAVAFMMLFIQWTTLLLTKKGRSLALSRLYRKIRWEFWPFWLIYLPCLPYFLYLMLRYRSFTLFALANPAIAGGGFSGESKWDIYNLKLPLITDIRWAITDKIKPHESSMDELNKFMKKNHLSYPVILKPDRGERGVGVSKIKSADEAKVYFKKTRNEIILQEYIPGLEVGVFYRFDPQSKKGKIVSITHKEFPTIVGDGITNIEEHILKDRIFLGRRDLLLSFCVDSLQVVIPKDQSMIIMPMAVIAWAVIFWM